MFTGIVQETGVITRLRQTGDSAVLSVQAHAVLDGIAHGASVAVDGVCVTVTDFTATGFTVDLMAETLRRTSLGGLRPGDRVNLERAMPASGRFDGHIVQGHVDGTGRIRRVTPTEHWTEVEFAAPADLLRYIVEKGSITVDGISLTVTGVTDEAFTVGLIPTTLRLTALGDKGVGAVVNLETDVLAKYAERLLATAGATR
ncbi:riboflavin synthase [Calidifontibacter sp. DB0510]|uniref:Riboflavin synthase n=1 Tax=Metallococcus carri TaxID=1656884 RepID=A0A967B054_9MICO|nr:riboflavin synthase [Metallococcus carri]NHN54995.1 riboflavin synthase [Metallococcus carri]NOP37341.1 riboflavin synthase [Calidifontibacter sp. DB2511S]